MTDEPVQRRLAAILAADVAGYSRLMGEDEAGALAAITKLRDEVLEPKITEHQGRLFKSMGDGFLAEFPSVVNAVACAAMIQKAMMAHNAGLPESRKMELRIGVHLGDVIAEGGDVFGDGVNVTARIVALAEPGGVAISATVHDHIGNRLALTFEDMGEQKLKNIAKPLLIYRLSTASRPVPEAATVRHERPSIAVLPFTNMSGDVEQDYFADGITEDIITELSRYRSLAVVARNSSFQFRGPGANLDTVQKALAVNFIVEGSVRKVGLKVRITAQLIDAATAKHIWAERYDRTIEDIFAVQDEVVQAIVSTVEGRSAVAGAAHVRDKPTNSWMAYDYFLQGRELSNLYRVVEADEFMARAIELDPRFVHAYAWRASTLVAKYWSDQQPETLQKARVNAETALSLDPSDATCHQAMGFVALHSNELTMAGMHFERALSLNPNDVNIIADYANWLSYMGRFADALQYLDNALQRDPFPPAWIWEIRGTALLQSRRYEEAISAYQRAPIPSENFFTHALLAAAFAWAGQVDSARRELALARQIKPDFSIELFSLPFAKKEHRNHIIDGLRLAVQQC